MLVDVIRDGVVESVHRGHLAVTDSHGRVLGGLGRPYLRCYARSALKPVQAATVLSVLRETVHLPDEQWRAGAGGRCDAVDDRMVAIAAASHVGTPAHVAQVDRLLRMAGCARGDLRCPPAWPADAAAAGPATRPAPVTHNCSGKHAAFLAAQAAAGCVREDYLDPSGALQIRVERWVAAASGAQEAALGRPGVDGCGAPAWRLPLAGLARIFARASTASGGDEVDAGLRGVARAMQAHPVLVGGRDCTDTLVMRSDARVVAKRGAEGVLAAGFAGTGVAVKITDGAGRATGPVVATVLRALGAVVDDAVMRPAVTGGGRVRGQVAAVETVRRLASGLPGGEDGDRPVGQ